MVLAHNIAEGDRTQDVQITQNVTFDSMLLASATLRGLKSSGFFKPSPIQLHGIPLGKCGFDLLLEAKSGTGKTAVFSVIALEQLDLSKGLQAIILAPTREIAFQIHDVITQIGSCYEGLRVEVVMGGLPIDDDIEKFKRKNVHIVVASPGRLRHLINDGHIDVSSIRLLVLDEADKLLEKCFVKDINYIFSIVPKQKQMLMSSATYPESTKSFIENYMQNAHHVCPETNSILLGIRQKITTVDHNCNIVKQTKNRFAELLKILTKFSFKQCLIFCNYQTRVAELHKMLTKEKWPSEQLYGQQEQTDRLSSLKALQEYKCRILVSTDLAARGIDASNIDLVINFEPPYEWQTYLHRIGRAGRYGSYGIAITILMDGREENKFTETLKSIQAPINLTNLWDDTVFKDFKADENAPIVTNISEDSETQSVEDFSLHIKTGKKFGELWKVLTSSIEDSSDQAEAKVETQSFEQLNDSFNKPDFESFSDLLTSHENHKEAKETPSISNYPQIQAAPLIKYLQNCGPNTKLQGEESNEKIPTTDIKSTNSNEIELTNNSDLKKNITNNIDLESQKVKPYRSAQLLKQRKDPTSDDEYAIPNIDEDLIRAGLPTAFGKGDKNNSIGPKNKKTSKKNYYAYSKENSSKKYNQGSEGSSEDDKPKQNHVTAQNGDTEQETPDIKKETNLDDDINEIFLHPPFLPWVPCSPLKAAGVNILADDGSSDDSERYYNHETQVYGNHEMHENSTSSETEECSENDETDADESQNCYSHKNSTYSNWYRNLKLRVKQIEHAIYIEELSKI